MEARDSTTSDGDEQSRPQRHVIRVEVFHHIADFKSAQHLVLRRERNRRHQTNRHENQ
ncbi:Uncharacterised protein [Vibrio cholerae]|nr:Uncharacterised protein [Vibrio cholerae]CSC87704.1 Uncharacterised protein [Vibrio cholerae]